MGRFAVCVVDLGGGGRPVKQLSPVSQLTRMFEKGYKPNPHTIATFLLTHAVVGKVHISQLHGIDMLKDCTYVFYIDKHSSLGGNLLYYKPSHSPSQATRVEHKLLSKKTNIVRSEPISTWAYFKVRFIVLTLKPYITVSFNTIFFKLTCTRSQVPQLSGEKNRTVLSSLDNFWHILKCKKVEKRPYTVKTLLKIKILHSHITHKLVEILQKFQRF